MSDQNPSSSPTVVVVPTPSAPAQPTAPAAAQDSAEKITLTSKQLDKRLAEERERGARRLLRDLGIEKENREDAIKQAREGLLALTQREKVEAEQRRQMDELQAKAKRADDFAPLVTDFAKKEFEALPEDARTYIANKAGEDPLARYNMIKDLKADPFLSKLLQSSAAPAAPVAPTEPVAPRVPNPATTISAVQPDAPKTGTDMDEYQTWRQLLAAGRTVEAANYLAPRHAKIMNLMSTKYSKPGG